MLSAEQLHAIMPALKPEKAATLLAFVQAAITEFSIEAPARCAAFLAQVAHESGQFKFMEELWGPTSQQLRYEPVTTLATTLGNSETGDGKRFKGRGPIQITGRSNYRRYGDLLGVDLVADPPRAAVPEVGFRTAGLFWKKNGLNEPADLATPLAFQQITRRINGGLTGLAERERFYAVAKTVLGVLAADASGAGVSRGRVAPPTAPSPEPAFERGYEAIRTQAEAEEVEAGAARSAKGKKRPARKPRTSSKPRARAKASPKRKSARKSPPKRAKKAVAKTTGRRRTGSKR